LSLTVKLVFIDQEVNRMNKLLPVAVIGAGPVGLAAAAHLIERGETPIIFEAGEEIGLNVRTWSHVRMFSPWKLITDQASVRLLEAHGWQMPIANALPTGGDLLARYLVPLSELPEVRSNLQLNAQVVAISRKTVDKMKDSGREDAPFILHIVYGEDSEAFIEARAVIDASGTWQQPNPMGANGLPAIGEKQHASRIAYGIPDILGCARARYENKRVMVVGSGHSALNVLLELAELSQTAPHTQIVWAMRDDNLRRVYRGSSNDTLQARGQLATRIQTVVEAGTVRVVSPFHVREVAAGDSGLIVTGESNDGVRTEHVDEIIVATGSRPQLDMLRELRLDLDPSLESTRQLAPMIDPNLHSCATVRPHGESELRQPEKNFYIVGMKSYGRAPTFLLSTGYEQVRSVVAALVGDLDAARNVQLNLPETGIYSTDLGEGGTCCITANAQQVLLSLDNITLNGASLQPIPAASQTVSLACEDNDICCGDAIRSNDCDSDGTCCS
jgi:thioredoxin reductase